MAQIKKLKTVKQARIVKTTCDRCNKIIAEEKDINMEPSHFACAFGYGSIYDGELWLFDLCDDCATWLGSQIKISKED